MNKMRSRRLESLSKPMRQLGNTIVKRLDIIIFIYGLGLGYAANSYFDVILHFIYFKNLNEAVPIVLLIFGFLLFLVVGVYKKSRRKLFQSFFLGVSAISFFLALLGFFNFPETITAGGRSWITYGKEILFPLGVENRYIRLSDIIYFIAKTLWSILIGSFFAVLDRFLTAFGLLK
jgi:hypothetical protein